MNKRNRRGKEKIAYDYNEFAKLYKTGMHPVEIKFHLGLSETFMNKYWHEYLKTNDRVFHEYEACDNKTLAKVVNKLLDCNKDSIFNVKKDGDEIRIRLVNSRS